MRSGNVTKEGEGEVTYMLCVTGSQDVNIQIKGS